MSINTVILLLGTNLNNRKKNLSDVKKLLQKEIGLIQNESIILETEPEGYISDNLFLNQTVTIVTYLSPIQVLTICKNIEKKIGRVYLETTQNYQDRLIDIDILVFNNIKYVSSRLIIPHHQIYSRNFVKKIL